MDSRALDHTLGCGQCFRWRRLPDGAWEGVVGTRVLRVSPQNFGQAVQDAFWAGYFDMDTDYAKIRGQMCGFDPALARAVCFAPEIRILRQDPWEALCSFLLSQCCNIPRIMGMVERLCRAYGSPLGEDQYAFPRPEQLAAAREKDLRALGFGYRAIYLCAAARNAVEGKLDFGRIAALPLAQARAGLTELEGVGPKVADCVLLYGLHRMDAFPSDVWIKRAMKTLFPGREAADFGPWAGLAQQYIFHYSRCHPELFADERKERQKINKAALSFSPNEV